MTELQLRSDLYIAPTPAGAYLATTSLAAAAPTALLRYLLHLPTTPALTLDFLQESLADHFASEPDALDVTKMMQAEGLIQGLDAPAVAPEESLEELLPDLLGPLSHEQRALLADEQGFCLSSVGFADSSAVETAALSADIAGLYARHNLAETTAAAEGHSPAWALVDTFGNSQVGYWPLYIGSHQFTLVIAGLPRLNHQRFVDLVWSLSVRYGGEQLATAAANADASGPPPLDRRST